MGGGGLVSKEKRPDRAYTGVLGEQILLADRHKHERQLNPRGPWLSRAADRLVDDRFIRAAREAKLPALFAHYAIDPNGPKAWQALACALAARHVPGFQARRKTGAPNSVGLETLCKLYRYANIQQAKRANRKRRLSAVQICTTLAKNKEFKRAIPELADCSNKRLQNCLSEARTLRRARVKSMVEVWRLKRVFSKDELDELPWTGDTTPWSYEKYNPWAKFHPEKG